MLESGDPSIKSLGECQRADHNAIPPSKERLASGESAYYRAEKTGLDARVAGTSALLRDSNTAFLKALQDEAKVYAAPIYKLPSELMEIIFKYLDSDARLMCHEVCVRWDDILNSKEDWKIVHPTILGPVADLDAKWKKILKREPKPSALVLKMWESPADKKKHEDLTFDQLNRTLLYNAFPCETLSAFYFEGNMRGIDYNLWVNCVIMCPNLKTLHWTSKGSPPGLNHAFKFFVGQSCPLFEWRPLREFVFDVDRGSAALGIDWGFVQMLRQTGKLSLIKGLGRHHVLTILNTAEYYLKELRIESLHHKSRWWEYESTYQMHTVFDMPHLLSIHVQDKEIGLLSITAPSVTSVYYGHGSIVDGTLLASCRHGIKSLHVALMGATTTGHLGGELFDMPHLERLHLDYRREPRPRNGDEEGEEALSSYHGYSTAALWQTVSHGTSAETQAILPMLKFLRIVHDPMLTETTFLRFAETRMRHDHPAIGKVELWLANHCSDNIDGLKAIQKTQPGFSTCTFDEWKSEGTREWPPLIET